MKRKCDKLYVKWKVYDNSINRWIDKKGIVYSIDIIWNESIFSQSLWMLHWNVKVELGLFNYVTN